MRAIISRYGVLAKGASGRHRLEFEFHNKQAVKKTIDPLCKVKVYEASEAQVDLSAKLLQHLRHMQSESTSPHTQCCHFRKHIPDLSKCAEDLYARHVANSHQSVMPKFDERAEKLRKGDMKAILLRSERRNRRCECHYITNRKVIYQHVTDAWKNMEWCDVASKVEHFLQKYGHILYPGGSFSIPDLTERD